MTKTLTEQWREGKLADGYYYMSFDETDNKPIIYHCTEYRMNNCRWHNEEVLAPVLDYDEYCNLVFQANKPKNPLSDVMMYYDTEREKKVVERLQEQKQKVIALIKDGRFVEALQELENESP